MKNINLFFFLLLSFSTVTTYAMEFNLGFWSKKLCQRLDKPCLAQPLDKNQLYSMQEPLANSATKLVIEKANYTAHLLWTKRDQLGGYYSFQVELYNKQGTLITQCARYESLDTFENAPVGSCSGTDHEQSKVVGISIYLP